jgi:RAD51-like protein 2
VHVVRCTTLGDQLAAVLALDALLDSLPPPAVKLVILDSVAFHFRYYDPGEAATRGRDLHVLAQALHRIAMDRRIAVLVVNQVVSSGDREQTGAAAAAVMTSHDGSGGGGGPRLVPALGESWAHACTNRILLEWAPEGHRIARLVKSASRAPGSAAYAVVADGVRSLKSGEALPVLRQHLIA